MRFLILVSLLATAFVGKSWSLKVGLLLDGPETQKKLFLQVAEELSSSFRLEGLRYYVVSYDAESPLYAIRRAKAEGVAVLVGPLEPQRNEEAIQAARAYGLPIVLLTGDLDPLRMPEEPFRGVFRTGISPRIAAKSILRCLAHKDLRRVGVLLSLDQHGRTGLKWLKAYAWEYRLQLVKTVWFGPQDTTLFHRIEEILPAEALIVWCGKEATLNVVREMDRFGLKMPVVFGPAIAEEEFLRSHPELYRRPFPAPSLFLDPPSFLREGPLLSLKLSAFADALYLVKEILQRGRYPTEKGFESLGLVNLPGGTYYISSDDHYGLLPQSVGLLIYDLEGFRLYCPPGSL